MVTLILAIAAAVCGILTVVLVCLQEPKENGLSGSISGLSGSYVQQHKGRTKESRFKRATVICGILATLFCLAANLPIW